MTRTVAGRSAKGGWAACRISLVRLAIVLPLAFLPASGCLSSSKEIIRLNEYAWVDRLEGTSARENPPIALLADLTLQDYEISLRRVLVIYSSWAGVVESDPQPLFTDPQVAVFTQIMKKHMPGLKADQRLLFRFKEPHENLDVLMEVYADGEFLVLEFKALSRDINVPAARSLENFNRASIVPQEGQKFEERLDLVVLREPIRRDTVALARVLQQKLNLIAIAEKDEVIAGDEAGQLREIVRGNAGIALSVFKQFISTRTTLNKALRQGLFNQTEFEQRRVRLLAELQQ